MKEHNLVFRNLGKLMGRSISPILVPEGINNGFRVILGSTFAETESHSDTLIVETCNPQLNKGDLFGAPERRLPQGVK